MGALAVIDIQERDGHLRRRHEITRWPVSIGRALDCDIILDDLHVAGRHLQLDEEEGRVTFSVGGTCNGIRINRTHHPSGASGSWGSGQDLHLGHSILRLRTGQDPLAQELPLHPSRTLHGAAATLVLGVLFYVLLGIDTWLGATGEAPLWRVLSALFITVTFLLAIWAVAWSLVSKLFSKQASFGRHLRIVLASLLLMVLAEILLELAAFSFNLPLLDRHLPLLYFAAASFMVLAHLREIAGRWQPLAAISVAALGIAGAAAYQLSQISSTGHVAGKHYMTVLFPPALRLADGVSPEQFAVRTAAMKARLDAQARDPGEDGHEYPE